jgi:cytochrome c-type biogenesis protein CcmH
MAALVVSDRAADHRRLADPSANQAEDEGLMGWLVLFLLVALSLGMIWRFKIRGGLLTASAAALLLGASGYALQGSPNTPGAPTQSHEGGEVLPLTDARHAFYGHFTPAETWLRISEALARDGKSEDAVGILQNAVTRYPADPQLWIGLGNALVDHARGLTPPAELAYKRAAELSPGYPGPPFFYGLALARSGDRASAVAIWQQILKTAPKGAEWRTLVEQGVAALSASPRAAKPQAASGS